MVLLRMMQIPLLLQTSLTRSGNSSKRLLAYFLRKEKNKPVLLRNTADSSTWMGI